MDTSSVPSEYLCPISQTLMLNPCTISTGQTYERTNILRWFDECGSKPRCPLTNQVIEDTKLEANTHLQTAILQWLQTHDGCVVDLQDQPLQIRQGHFLLPASDASANRNSSPGMHSAATGANLQLDAMCALTRSLQLFRDHGTRLTILRQMLDLAMLDTNTRELLHRAGAVPCVVRLMLANMGDEQADIKWYGAEVLSYLALHVPARDAVLPACEEALPWLRRKLRTRDAENIVVSLWRRLSHADPEMVQLSVWLLWLLSLRPSWRQSMMRGCMFRGMQTLLNTCSTCCNGKEPSTPLRLASTIASSFKEGYLSRPTAQTDRVSGQRYAYGVAALAGASGGPSMGPGPGDLGPGALARSTSAALMTEQGIQTDAAASTSQQPLSGSTCSTGGTGIHGEGTAQLPASSAHKQKLLQHLAARLKMPRAAVHNAAAKQQQEERDEDCTAKQGCSNPSTSSVSSSTPASPGIPTFPTTPTCESPASDDVESRKFGGGLLWRKALRVQVQSNGQQAPGKAVLHVEPLPSPASCSSQGCSSQDVGEPSTVGTESLQDTQATCLQDSAMLGDAVEHSSACYTPASSASRSRTSTGSVSPAKPPSWQVWRRRQRRASSTHSMSAVKAAGTIAATCRLLRSLSMADEACWFLGGSAATVSLMQLMTSSGLQQDDFAAEDAQFSGRVTPLDVACTAAATALCNLLLLRLQQYGNNMRTHLTEQLLSQLAELMSHYDGLVQRSAVRLVKAMSMHARWLEPLLQSDCPGNLIRLCRMDNTASLGEALAALSSIASACQEDQRIHLAHLGAVSACAHLLACRRSTAMCSRARQSAAQVLEHLCLPATLPLYRRPLRVNQGGAGSAVDVVMELLADNQERRQLSAVRVLLGLLEEDPETAASFALCEPLSLAGLIRLLGSRYSHARCAAATLLHRAAVVEDNQPALAKAGCIPALVEVLQGGVGRREAGSMGGEVLGRRASGARAEVLEAEAALQALAKGQGPLRDEIVRVCQQERCTGTSQLLERLCNTLCSIH